MIELGRDGVRARAHEALAKIAASVFLSRLADPTRSLRKRPVSLLTPTSQAAGLR